MDVNKEKNPNVLLNKYADKMSETVLNFIESNDIMGRKFTIDRKNDDFFLEYGLANFTIKLFSIYAHNKFSKVFFASGNSLSVVSLSVTLLRSNEIGIIL